VTTHQEIDRAAAKIDSRRTDGLTENAGENVLWHGQLQAPASTTGPAVIRAVAQDADDNNLGQVEIVILLA